MEEELGISLPDGALGAAPSFCIAAEQAPLGGCNCFEDVYFAVLPGASALPPLKRFKVGAAEVAGLKWVSLTELREAWEGRGAAAADYVPRTAAYQAAFLAELAKLGLAS